MLNSLKMKISNGLGYRNGRSFVPDEDDTMLVGYPKSGNTWLNFLIASMVSPSAKDVDFLSIERIVPDIYINNGFTLKSLEKPRILKSHEPFHSDYGKVVYIVRDPRMVAVSYYYHHLKLMTFDETYLLDDFVQAFVLGQWDSFGTWGNHVGGWLKRKNSGDFMLVKYEDLRKKQNGTLRKIISFLGLVFDEYKIDQAIDWCTAENMSNLEKKNFNQHVSFKETRKDIPFVQSGQGKRELLSSNAKIFIEEKWGDVMKELGYL